MAITIENIPGTADIKITSGTYTHTGHVSGLEYGTESGNTEYWLRFRSAGPDFSFGKSDVTANIPTINGVACATIGTFIPAMESLIATATAAGAASGSGNETGRIPQIGLSFQDDVNPKRMTTAKDAGGYGTITRSAGILALNSGGDPGVDPPGYACFQSRDIITIQPGQTIEVVFYAAFQAQDPSSQVLFGIDNGTLAADPQTGEGIVVGFRGEDFGLFVKKNGTFTPHLQTAWNIDKADGTGQLPDIDPYYLNRYKLTVSHGSGVLLSICNEEGIYYPAHRVEWNNTVDTAFTLNWAFKLFGISDNRYGMAPVAETVLKLIESAAFQVGELPTAGRRLTITQAIASVTSTETVILNTYNHPTWSGDPNLRRARIESVSFCGVVSGGAPNGPLLVRVYLTTTIPGGAPAFAAVDATTSIMQKDTAGTLAATAADCIGGITIADSGQGVWVPESPVYQLPGEYMTITGIVPAVSGTGAGYVAINLIEE